MRLVISKRDITLSEPRNIAEHIDVAIDHLMQLQLVAARPFRTPHETHELIDTVNAIGVRLAHCGRR